MQIALELADEDLKHFELIMRESRKSAAHAPPEAIVAGARQLLTQIRESRVPEYVRQRLEKLELMIAMLADHEWRLPEQDALQVLNALAYFCEPQDLIPDHIPGIGFLDDAIMIDLVEQELRHELEAYQDFCAFRNQRPVKHTVKARGKAVTRDEWLDSRREELQSRMRRRKRKSRAEPYS